MVDYDWSDGEEGFKVPTPGVYRFEVKDANEKTSAAGNKYLSLECRGVGHDARMWFMLHFTPKSLRVTKPTLVELGVPQGLTPLKPYYFVGTVFDADCQTEKSPPNAQGKSYTNLRVFTDSALPGFTMGVRLVERTYNMPETATPTAEDEGPF